MLTLRVAAAGIAMTLLLVTPAWCQDGKWILGVWEGHHSHRNILSDNTTFEFRDDGGAIRWKMHVTRQTGNGRSEHEAEGTLTKVTDSSADLDGQYTASSNRYFVGKALRYSLTGGPNGLVGSAFGADNVSFSVTLTRAK